MQRSKIDIVDKILNAAYKEFPDAIFIQSLMHQYEERGSLSKKQLEGLLLKATKARDIPENWLGTLEAIIKKMPTRFKSELPEPKSPFKDEAVGMLLSKILSKAPQHKQALFLKDKYEKNIELTALEIRELERFAELLSKKK